MLIDTQNIRTISGVRLVRLIGNKEERAIQHGRLIASLALEERGSLAMHPLAIKNQTLIRRSFGDSFGRIGAKLYQSYVFRLFKKLPKELREPLRVFTQAAQLKYADAILALYQPDMLMVLAGLTGEKAKNTFLSGMPGCSTAVFMPPEKTNSSSLEALETSRKERMLFLRNLDYPAAAAWEKWPTVFYQEPSENGSLRFTSIGSLGVPLAGLTGWNECGVGFSLHAHFSKKVSPSETPIFFLGEEILQKARTLEEAIFFCRKFKTIGSWALNLVSFKENKAASVEISDGKISVREISGSSVLAHTNGFQNPEFKESEVYFNGAFFEDVHFRKKSLEGAFHLGGDHSAHPEPFLQSIDALSSHVDHATGETRVFGNTVSLVTTIQSVVVNPSEQSFYLSVRNETPTPLGPYLKLPFRWEELTHTAKSLS